MKLKKKTLKIFDIVSFVAVFIFFIFAIICTIFRFTGAKFSLFGNRYDVVLTDSMSIKNDEHKDFLEGHDDQIQAFDLVKSRKISGPDDIQQFDIVIYKDRNIGTNMHRVVNIETESKETITFKSSNIKTIGEYEGYELNDDLSYIVTNDISYTHLEMTTYSLLENVEDNYYFNAMSKTLAPEVTSVQDGIGKLTTYKITRDSAAPCVTNISHKHTFDYSKEIIVSIKLDSAAGQIECDSKNTTSNGTDFTRDYNQSYKYEIRGDKAKNSDGWYRFDELEAKVVKNIPRAGYFVRFLGSLWGGIMFLLLGLLILATNIIMTHLNKKELASQTAESETKVSEDKQVSPAVEETKAEEKPVDEPKEEAIPEPEKPNDDFQKQEELNKKMAEIKAAQEAAKKAEQKAKEAEARARAAKEGIATDKKEQPARVNGRFVSKNPAKSPAKPASNSSRWTKDNNPSANKKRVAGGDK